MRIQIAAKPLMLGLALAAGCQPAAVYQVSTGGKLTSGVPFFRRMPARKERVVFEQSWFQVDVAVHVRASVAAGKSGEQTMTGRGYFTNPAEV